MPQEIRLLALKRRSFATDSLPQVRQTIKKALGKTEGFLEFSVPWPKYGPIRRLIGNNETLRIRCSEPKRDDFSPRTMTTNRPRLASDLFYSMLDRICDDEVSNVIASGLAEPSDEDRAQLRQVKLTSTLMLSPPGTPE